MGLLDKVGGGAGHLFGEVTGSNRYNATARDAASMAQFTPWDVSTPFGTSTFQDGKASFAMNPQYSGLFGNFTDTIGSMTSQDGLLGGNQKAGMQELYGFLSKMAQPGQNRAVNSMENKLFARGMLGSTGGAEMMGQLQDSFNRADLGRQVQAYQMATDAANSAAQRAATGMGMFGNLNNMYLNQILAGANIGGMDASAGATAGQFLTNAAQGDMMNRSALFGSMMDAIPKGG